MTVINDGRPRRRSLLAIIRGAFGHKLREEESGLTDFDLLPSDGLNGHIERDIGYRRDRRRDGAVKYSI